MSKKSKKQKPAKKDGGRAESDPENETETVPVPVPEVVVPVSSVQLLKAEESNVALTDKTKKKKKEKIIEKVRFICFENLLL